MSFFSFSVISIHKALAGLDLIIIFLYFSLLISIHKALAGLDQEGNVNFRSIKDFNPQGPRGPRRIPLYATFHRILISIHKALAGLD